LTNFGEVMSIFRCREILEFIYHDNMAILPG